MKADSGLRLFDPVRGKTVRAFPEERVRLQLAAWLADAVGVPARLMAVEYSLSRLDPRCRKRADIVVWRPGAGEGGGLSPWLLAECKAPGVPLTGAVADRIRRYAEKVRADHALITNGTETLCFLLRNNRYEQVANLPRFLAGAREAGKVQGEPVKYRS